MKTKLPPKNQTRYSPVLDRVKNPSNFSSQVSFSQLNGLQSQTSDSIEFDDLDKVFSEYLEFENKLDHQSFWKEFLSNDTKDVLDEDVDSISDSKAKAVRKVIDGNVSVAELCRQERISHETFLDWSRCYLKSSRSYNKSNNKLLLQRLLQLESFGGFEFIKFLESYINIEDYSAVAIESSSEWISDSKSIEGPKATVCLYRMNDLRRINKHYERINRNLKKGDILIGCLETFTARNERMWVNKIPILRNVFFSLEFLFKRIVPKLNFSKRLYFDLTQGRDRLLSKAEGLGRLVSCGFSIVDFRSINGLVYFVVKKTGKPEYNLNPSYGPIYAMPRIGKNGKIIRVLKLRTMHPFSEYLQDYIVRANGYAESGKPADDFRIPKWGKVMRRFWLDELPQIINFLKGDLKLVGVRPVSERYFNDIPKEMQKLRLTQKPGCIPPYVSLNRPGNVMSVLQSEKQYLEEKVADPYFTDIKYFFNAIFNIIVKKKRSA